MHPDGRAFEAAAHGRDLEHSAGVAHLVAHAPADRPGVRAATQNTSSSARPGEGALHDAAHRGHAGRLRPVVGLDLLAGRRRRRPEGDRVLVRDVLVGEHGRAAVRIEILEHREEVAARIEPQRGDGELAGGAPDAVLREGRVEPLAVEHRAGAEVGQRRDLERHHRAGAGGWGVTSTAKKSRLPWLGSMRLPIGPVAEVP